jgi:hypothetical protein
MKFIRFMIDVSALEIFIILAFADEEFLTLI